MKRFRVFTPISEADSAGKALMPPCLMLKNVTLTSPVRYKNFVIDHLMVVMIRFDL